MGLSKISDVANHRAPRAIDDRGDRAWVFQTTVQRMLLRLGLQSRRLVHAPMLIAAHRQRRLEFARQYHNWTSSVATGSVFRRITS
ncbi:hypothetical protein TNCV_4735611 [Trichonephila clavipes]|nr:hypothetical protein TNCV_4735611 [Trichonephila clavipes]